MKKIYRQGIPIFIPFRCKIVKMNSDPFNTNLYIATFLPVIMQFIFFRYFVNMVPFYIVLLNILQHNL